MNDGRMSDSDGEACRISGMTLVGRDRRLDERAAKLILNGAREIIQAQAKVRSKPPSSGHQRCPHRRCWTGVPYLRFGPRA